MMGFTNMSATHALWIPPATTPHAAGMAYYCGQGKSPMWVGLDLASDPAKLPEFNPKLKLLL